MTAIDSILPPNSSVLEQDFEQTTATRLNSLTSNLQYLMNPDKCPNELLPWLAWAVSVDVWSDDWTDEQKRTTIRESVQVHRQKGTLGALKRALIAFDYANIDIKEWFEYGGDPYTFRVVIQFITDGASLQNCEDIYKTIMQTKNLRSWLESIGAIIETQDSTPNLAVAFGYSETICVYPKE